MKQYKILEDYVKDGELDIETIIKEHSGYVYTSIKNMQCFFVFLRFLLINLMDILYNIYNFNKSNIGGTNKWS